MGELYTRTDADGRPNTEIEEWFSKEIETPFLPVLERIISLPGKSTSPAPWNPQKEKVLRQLGFITGATLDFITLTNTENEILAHYIAALLARTPKYLQKINVYHERVFPADIRWGPFNREALMVQANLNHMRTVIETYRVAIASSDLIFLKAKREREFLYSDTGIFVPEPWNDHGVPFDIHVPLTPEISVEVLPVPNRAFVGKFPLAYLNAQGVSRMNRIIVGNAENFIFSRSSPPLDFIHRNFGVPAPKCIGTRVQDGRVVAFYDPSRDR